MPTIAQQLKDKLGVDGSNITEILNNAGGHGANIAEAIRHLQVVKHCELLRFQIM